MGRYQITVKWPNKSPEVAELVNGEAVAYSRAIELQLNHIPSQHDQFLKRADAFPGSNKNKFIGISDMIDHLRLADKAFWPRFKVIKEQQTTLSSRTTRAAVRKNRGETSPSITESSNHSSTSPSEAIGYMAERTVFEKLRRRQRRDIVMPPLRDESPESQGNWRIDSANIKPQREPLLIPFPKYPETLRGRARWFRRTW